MTESFARNMDTGMARGVGTAGSMSTNLATRGASAQTKGATAKDHRSWRPVDTTEAVLRPELDMERNEKEERRCAPGDRACQESLGHSSTLLLHKVKLDEDDD